MNRSFIPARCGLLLILLTAPVMADEILIYKYASARPWTLYACLRPDAVSTAAAPVVPKNTLSGTYTQTEYWVVNKTTGHYAIVHYSANAYKGAIDKTYRYETEERPLTRTVTGEDGLTVSEVPTVAHLSAGRPGIFNTSLQFGEIDASGDEDGGGYFVTEQAILTGQSKPYTVAPGLVFQQVPATLKGPYIYSHREESVTTDTGAPLRSLYFEKKTTNTMTLDAAATKKANLPGALVPYGGGGAIPNGSIAYGLRVVGLQLEAIGYDFVDATPGS